MQQSNKMVRATTDVGGTFTDLVYFESDDTTGEQIIRTAKSDTTPPNFEQGVLDVINKSGIDIADVQVMAHGTTVVINALTERKGAKTALITTKGFRDVLEIGRGNRPDYFNLNYQKPVPFIPRYLRFEIAGRVDYKGSETEALMFDELDAIVEKIKTEEIQAVAICLINAYANPMHEIILFDALTQRCPELSIIASHQISREWREYERTSTAALSAYVQPLTSRYLDKLDDALKHRGFKGNFYVVQSNCGVNTLEATKKIPITMVESGPASGFWGAAELGRIINEPNILALDIGGTTAKCSLIKDSKVTISSDYYIERNEKSAGYPILVPVVDLVEIGNGGGSIASVDDYGKLHVGPESAGANPGPVAYGRGGINITTTDANLALGRINPDYFCGGTVTADLNAVINSLEAIGDKLGLSAMDAAQGVIRIANNNMVNALKLISVNKGHDPRDFTMVAFGGGGGMHASALAEELGINKIIIPSTAAVFSAWGMMMSDIRRDLLVTLVKEWNIESVADINQTLGLLKQQSEKQFEQESINLDSCKFQFFFKLRYQNQEHSIEVAIESHQIDPKSLLSIEELFHQNYEKEYTYRLNTDIEMVGIHLVAIADIGKLEPQPHVVSGKDIEQTVKGERYVSYGSDERLLATIYNGDSFEPGMNFHGPAIIEQEGTTTVINPNQKVVIDMYGNFHLTFETQKRN